jgi:hypothetical protein
MAQDYPDYMQSVTRTPIQKLSYQAFGHIETSRNAPAATADTYVFNLPNDGLQYMIDTIFFVYFAHGPQFTSVAMCADQAAPVWGTISGASAEHSAEHVPSKSGACVLTYPQALEFTFDNRNNSVRNWQLFMNYFTYTI